MVTTLGPYEVEGAPQGFHLTADLNFVWDVATLDWVEMTQPGGGGGGGAVTIADGDDVALGATTDAEAAAGNGTVVAILKRLRTLLNGGLPAALVGGRLSVDVGASALPTGAATAALQTQPGVDIGDVTVNNGAGAAAVNVQDGGNSITVDAASLPLPTGAATEATLATRLADATFTGRINTQGQKAMATSTPVVIASDQSAVPVSGTVAVSKTDLTPASPAVAAVGTSSAQAVAANANRKGLHLRNLSTTGQRISLGFGAAAVLDSGVTLYPQDAFEMGEYDFDLGAVNAISSAASGSLGVQEYTT